MVLAELAQMVSIILACLAIIAGIDAWKREFIGKRRIEIAESVLAKFYEIRDAIAYIRNPWSSSEEGKTRKRGSQETQEESNLLDGAYIVFERYEKKKRYSLTSTLSNTDLWPVSEMKPRRYSYEPIRSLIQSLCQHIC